MKNLKLWLSLQLSVYLTISSITLRLLGCSLPFFLILSIVLGLRQINFFIGWVSLELNILVFVSMLLFIEENNEGLGMKYFVVQRVGSRLILFRVIFITKERLEHLFIELLFIALLIKIGLAPAHAWLVDVLTQIRWRNFFFASIPQKVLPLFYIRQIKRALVIIVVVISTGVRVLGGLFTLHIKKIFAYSSVFIGAWLLACQINFFVIIVYLISYGLGLFYISKARRQREGEIKGELNFIREIRFLGLGVRLFRIAGRPPLLGFFIKICVLRSLVLQENLGLVIILLIGSFIFLYIYLRVLIRVILNFNIVPLNLIASTRISRVIILIMLIIFPWWLCISVVHKRFWVFRV